MAETRSSCGCQEHINSFNFQKVLHNSAPKQSIPKTNSREPIILLESGSNLFFALKNPHFSHVAGAFLYHLIQPQSTNECYDRTRSSRSIEIHWTLWRAFWYSLKVWLPHNSLYGVLTNRNWRGEWLTDKFINVHLFWIPSLRFFRERKQTVWSKNWKKA